MKKKLIGLSFLSIIALVSCTKKPVEEPTETTPVETLPAETTPSESRPSRTIPAETPKPTLPISTDNGHDHTFSDYTICLGYHYEECSCGYIKYEEHSYENRVCTKCNRNQNDHLDKVFDYNTVLYNNSNMPDDIDLNAYGDNISAIIYEPKLLDMEDPYLGESRDYFYQNDYTLAESYEDAFYRTRHGIISGDITLPEHLPVTKTIYEGDKAIKITDGTYILDSEGGYLGYFTNSLDGTSKAIWYNGAYITLDEVCAYVKAFGEVPPNSNYHKNSGKQTSIKTWGKYGRVNIDDFSGNTTRYPYEPALPYISGVYSNGYKYTETDFGTYDLYKNGNITQKKYSDGYSIIRGAARIVFVSDSRIKKIEERYVFYTYNHYNDFQEYLNYDGGYGVRFGNETAGNPNCSSASDFLAGYASPTKYEETILKSMGEL